MADSDKGIPMVKLGSHALKIGSGATPRGGSQVYLEQGEIALIRSQNVFNGGFNRKGLVYINNDAANQLSNVTVQKSDILLNITGESVGRCCQVASDVLPARVNQHVAIIRTNLDEIYPDYLRYFLISPSMQSLMLSWAHAGATRKALTKGMIESFSVPKPSIKIQQAIAHILGTLDDKIELNRQMNETLEGIARALFKSWFVDFDPVRAKAEGRDTGLPKHIADLFPDSFEESELGEIPAGWTAEPLPELIEVNPSRPLRRGVVAPYLDMKNMPICGHSPATITQRPFTSGMRFTKGDTLLARITPCLENGKTAYVDFLAEGQIGWGSTEYIVLCPKLPLPAQFAYCLARSTEFRNFAIQSMTGSSGRQRVQASSLSHFLLAAPPAAIAKQFGNAVQPLFTRAKFATEQSDTLASLRDTLLPKLISGELRVKDAERIAEKAGV